MSVKSYIPLLICLFSAIRESQSLLEERVVNGNTIGIRQAPWQVSILVNSSHNCGGSILSNRFILTAAHCIENWLPVNLTVRAGSSYWKSGGQLLEVESFLVHEKWDDMRVINDIGVILLVQPLIFGIGVQPIKLAQEGPKAGDAAFVSGWGSVDYRNSIPTLTLQGLETSVLNQETCAAIYSSLSEDTLCTYNEAKGPWKSDSGGPLVVHGKLVGVVSWGWGNNTPAVYASVVHFYKWIQGAIKKQRSRAFKL